MLEPLNVQPHNPGYIYIDNNNALSSYIRSIEDRKISIIALDIEAENNLHAYGQKLCLVQIFDGQKAILIDALKVGNSCLKNLLENRDILKVMYGASSDISLLQNCANIQLKSVFDLYPAVMLLRHEKKDLHSVILSELGIELKDKRKFQKHNWNIRPINQLALNYAINDVLHLLPLKDSLMEKLYQGKLLERYLLGNLKVQNKDYAQNQGIKYARFDGYLGLPRKKKAIAKRIIDAIDKYAASCDMPFNSVIRKTDVVEIVKDPNYIYRIKFPKTFSERSVQGITGELQSILNVQASNMPFPN
jgi:ribonuclease D